MALIINLLPLLKSLAICSFGTRSMHLRFSQLALLLFLLPALDAGPLTPKQQLAAGLQAAESYNWTSAATYFRIAQQHLTGPDALLAQVGYMRSTMEQRNLAELTAQYQALSSNPLVQSN